MKTKEKTSNTTCKQIIIFLLVLSCIESCGSSERNRFRVISYNKKELSDRVSTNRSINTKFDAEEVVTNGSYGSGIYQRYDLFMPTPWKKTEQPPLLLFAHPGAFIMGDKQDYLIRRLCRDFARLGYATASINYQLIDLDLDNLTHSQRRKTLMLAVADARKAIKYLQTEHEYTPSKTVFVGYSAGAFIANHLVFSDVSEVSSYTGGKFPYFDLFNQPASDLLAGVVSISGGVLDYTHVDDSDVNDIPLLMIHGTKDKIVPFDRGAPFQKIVDDGIDYKIPGLYYELGGSYNGSDFSLHIGRGLEFDSQTLKLVRTLLFPDDLCGSNCIASDLKHKSNISLVQVTGAPHSLMHNSNNGSINNTYNDVFIEIEQFVKSQVNKTSHNDHPRGSRNDVSRHSDKRTSRGGCERRSSRYD